MYAALLHQELVLAVSEAAKVRENPAYLNQEVYRCPRCRKPVILVLSQKAEPFFKHYQVFRGLGEQEEHRQGKTLLKAALTAAGLPARLEVPLADGALRADVLANPGLAFEVQCAPLGQEEFAHRHALYRSIGIKDIWLVGRRHYLGEKLKQTQLIFFRENQLWGSYYLEIHQADSLLRLKYQVQQAPLSQQLVYRQEDFPLDGEGIAALWRFRPLLPPPEAADWLKERQYLDQQLKEKSRLGQKLGELMYLRGYTLADLPQEAFSHWRKPGEPSWLAGFLQQKTSP
ncbi:competence protein [Lactobacillus nasalidis]|uniref:Competence protein n=1 Tax=Lactobacillus nasalidis TaxID=2797258 RepID=A0ABQ3W2G2_9LACO|nr:competence protein CoiA family protein [Lactobacillus nasalidis]GHV98502.1 competence protein [Lactobacillus nasalidis]GHV99859.1 competence protein [Lactobacillus nasalidis]GHW00468.1 competence protein [Lactobacillus nasalidis]